MQLCLLFEKNKYQGNNHTLFIIRNISIFIVTNILIFTQCQTKHGEPIIARVGKLGYSYYDLKTLAKINELQPGCDTTLNAVQIYYEKALKYLYLADSMGYPITDSILTWEAHRIDKHTLMPARLDSIKQVCGDSVTYLRLFVLPQLAQRWLLSHFYWDTSIHKNTYLKAVEVLTLINYTLNSLNPFEAMSGIALKKVANTQGFNYQLYEVNAIEGIKTVHKNNNTPGDMIQHEKQNTSLEALRIENKSLNSMAEKNSTVANDLINKVLRKLNVGKIYNTPVELDDSFWVVQLIDFYKHSYYIAVVQIPKTDFFTWFETESKKIPIVYQ